MTIQYSEQFTEMMYSCGSGNCSHVTINSWPFYKCLNAFPLTKTTVRLFSILNSLAY